MKRFCVILVLFSVLLTGCGAALALPVSPDGTYTEEPQDGGVVERHFIIESEGHRLNAVYTYVPDGKQHPTVLLIAGSGPADCDATLGAWRPFRDIALGLASRGVCSLRVDKRTLNGADAFLQTDGVEEEYITDCLAALSCLADAGIKEIYLLGHSLGGQIAAELAVMDGAVQGMILFNSTARHLADVACDQYSRADKDHEMEYRLYADAAKGATGENAKGYYYYGATDHYWASYNRLNTVDSIEKAAIPTLIINSTADLQSFSADLEGWQPLAGKAQIRIELYDDISHFGYRADLSDLSVLEQELDFPAELLDLFAGFCKETK